MNERSTRRGLFGLVGTAAAGAPSLEATTAAQFRPVGKNGRAVALNEARRVHLDTGKPFFEASLLVDVSQVDDSSAKAASMRHVHLRISKRQVGEE